MSSKVDTKFQLKASSAQLKSWGRRAKGSLHLLMMLSLVDAIFLCAFYAVIVVCFAPFVLKQDTSYINYSYLALLPLAGRTLMRFVMAKVIASISYNLESAIREELIRKLLRVGPLSFAVKSSLSTLFVDALDDIMPYFTSFLVTMRYAMVIPVICLIAVAIVSPWSALILFAMAPLIPFFMMIIGKGAERLNQRQWKQITRLALRFHEALDKLSLIKLFNLERQEVEKIARLTKRWRVETMQVLRIAFLSALVLEFFATCGIALCAITLGFAVYEHGFDYTRALFVLLLAPEFFLPLRQLGLTYHARMRALGAMSSLIELLGERDIFKEPADLATGTNASALDAAKAAAAADAAADAAAPRAAAMDAAHTADGAAAGEGDQSWLQGPFTIELRGITALYPNGRVGISDFSALVKPNVTSALVGPSGAGKSTILQTIAGFTKLESGAVVVNGHVCSHGDLLSLMPHIAYIPQLPNLFYGTLRDNLKLGVPDATDQDLIKALEMVGASELLSRFADGLDHHVGDQNRGISGGETRLIALARALVRNSEILLLDEPTASLDRDSENRFLAALKGIAAHKTVLIVAHRAELIAFADQVIEVQLPVAGASTSASDSTGTVARAGAESATEKKEA